MYVFQADSVVRSLEDVDSGVGSASKPLHEDEKVPIEINRRRRVITHLPYRTFK